MSNYYCKKCLVPATITKDGKIIKLCECKSAVVADMTAKAFGIGRTAKDAKQS